MKWQGCVPNLPAAITTTTTTTPQEIFQILISVKG